MAIWKKKLYEKIINRIDKRKKIYMENVLNNLEDEESIKK